MPRLEQLLSLLSEMPNDSFILFALAKEYEKSGNEEQAGKYYQKLAKSNPSYVGLYYHFAKWHERNTTAKEAFATYTLGMEVAKVQNDQHAYQELAGARLHLGDEEDFMD